MIRVLHIAKDLAPNSGITTYLRTVLAAQAKRGDTEVYLMTGSAFVPSDMDFVQMRYSMAGWNAEGARIIDVLRMVWTLARFCRREHIDIIHTHHRLPELAAVIASLFVQCRTIASVHSLVTGKPGFSFRSHRLIAVSRKVEAMLTADYRVPTHKITMLYNPVTPVEQSTEADVNKLREELGLRLGDKVILFIGRHDPIKGPDIIMSAFRDLSRTRPFLTLLMVGDETLSTVKKDFCGTNSEIVRTPPRKDVHLLYQLSDMVVMPSRREPLGYTMLEAGRSCRPFIGSDVDGIAEFVTNGIDGLLFPVGDVHRLSECILKVLDDEEEALRLATAFKAKVDALPDAEKYADALQVLYHSMMAEIYR